MAAYHRANEALATDRASGLFRGILVDFSAWLEASDLSPSFKRDLRWAVARLDEKFGDAPAAIFDRPEIRRRISKWREDFKPRDADRLRQGLTKIATWAIGEEKLRTNPVAGLENAYEADRNHLIWVDDEIDAAVAAAEPHLAAAIRLWAETGLRPGDLCRATEDQIVAGGTILRVRASKRGRWAMVPITKAAAEVIAAWPAGQKHLPKPPRAECWTPTHLSKSIKAVARAASARKELHPYDLRGSAVTRLVLAGIGVADLAMGWEPETAAKMIRIYAALDRRRTSAVMQQLNATKDSGLRLVVG